MRAAAWSVCLLTIALLSGCADRPSTPGALDVAAEVLSDAEVPSDVQSDVSQFDFGTHDDVLQCPGNAGCACSASADCSNGLCVETAEGGRCATLCTLTCPAGFACRSTTTTGDPISYCAPVGVRQCAPCNNHADCNAPLSVAVACVSAGNAGSFCATSCQTSSDCPSGTTCEANPDGGAPVCLPDGGSAACTCGAWAKSSGASTACGVVEGSERCPGTRSCSADGLGACVKTAGAVCVDVGCADAADGSPCDDGDPCTQSECAAGKCQVTKDSCACKKHSECAGQEDGNLCNGTLMCDTSSVPYVCKVDPATVVVCPAPSDACSINTCQPTNGACSTSLKPDNSACDDGDNCTADTTCASGVCGGGKGVCECQASVDCLAKEDGNACNGTLYCDSASHACKVDPTSVVNCPPSGNPCELNTCQPVSGTCAIQNLPNNTPCDDGALCTIGDICLGGTCKAGTVTCACSDDSDCGGYEDGNQCNGTLFCNKATGQCQVNPKTVVSCPSGLDTTCQQNVCEPSTGACGLATAPSTTLCDDGNPCSGGDHCAAGVCTSTTELCPCDETADCAASEDGNLCNGTLYCELTSHTCQINPASVVVCPFVGDNPCAPIQCQPTTGECVPSPVVAGSCDDGDPCTAPGGCVSGQCVPGPNICQCKTSADCLPFDDGNPCNGTFYCDTTSGQCKPNLANVPVCPPAMDACSSHTCDPASGACKLTAAKDGAQCSDGEPCTKGDACESGSCKAGPSVCACITHADCASNDDGNLCNGVWLCNKEGSVPECVFNPASIVICDTTSDGACRVTSCNPATGQCASAEQQGPCDDGDACTGSDGCGGGACLPGNAVSCNDDNPCTTDSCSPGSGCVFTPNGELCDDGNLCTQADVCASGACVGSNPVVCTAIDLCHEPGVCEAVSGECSHPTKSNDAPCNDGDACSQTDTCQGGTCQGSNPVVCNALDQCHVAGTCDKTTGACSNPNRGDGEGCDDGNACTQSDACAVGVCTGTNPIVCSAQDQCHEPGICEPSSGACSQPSKADGSTCSDGDGCTQTDACQTGACVGSNPVVCTALDQCHEVGSCNAGTGTCSQPVREDASPCSDGNACTAGDVCGSGACLSGTAKVCDDGNACTSDSCNTVSGACVYTNVANTTPCDDGSLCTELDACWSGSCDGIPCGDVDDYTSDTCDPAVGCVGIEICNGADDDGDGTTDNVVCGGNACTCDAMGVASCPVGCTECPNYDDLAITVTDSTGTLVRCIPDWHAWGIVPDTPDTIVQQDALTATDSRTGRMWHRATTQNSATWSEAKDLCDAATIGGYTDWRLPTLAELESLVDFRTQDTAIDLGLFPDTTNVLYWSSTSAEGGSNVFGVAFGNGATSWSPKQSYTRTRCVR